MSWGFWKRETDYAPAGCRALEWRMMYSFGSPCRAMSKLGLNCNLRYIQRVRRFASADFTMRWELAMTWSSEGALHILTVLCNET